MDQDKKITKIVVKQEDELTDIVTAILNARSERIVLTFAEETDLLISPINLKVLLETADEKEKLLVAQIIKNPTGLRNANLAGLSTTDSPQFPEEDIWEAEEINRAKRLSPPKKGAPAEKIEERKKKDTQLTDFQKRIDTAIAKSKERSEGKELKDDDILITLDEDLPSEDFEPEITILKEDSEQKGPSSKETSEQDKKRLQKKEPNLSKVDFSDKTKDPIKRPTKKRKKLKKGEASKKIKGIFSSIGAFFAKIPVPHKMKKLAPILGISFVVLAILVGLIYLNTALLVRVRIYVEAKEVEVERVFEGDENINEIDFENSKIPVKTESVEKARSSPLKATGTAFRGEKATGAVNIWYRKEDGCTDVDPIEIPSDQTISTEGKLYRLNSAVSVECNDTAEAAVTAVEVGEEYNLASGQFFTIQGYSSTEIWATNSGSAFTGGSKEEYTVLSKADVDRAIEELSQIAIEEGEGELKDLAGSWDIISDSITSKVLPDSIKTDVAIGQEATNANVSVTTESTASYFLKEGFDSGVEGLLTNKAKEDNLFETDKDWALELDKEIEKEISVVESNAEEISIKLVARSAVKPKVDTEEILSELKTMNWEEGQEYLKSLEFSEKETRVEFYPEWFPEGLRMFPKRQGGVLITISNIN
jgi:hypothetical protein